MSTKWSKEEELKLAQKVKQYGHQWEFLKTFFPNRSPNSIRQHYQQNKDQISDLNQLETDIEETKESDDIKIQHILNKKIKYNEKIEQLKPFAKETVFENIINISNTYPTITAEISMLLKYIFDFKIYEKSLFLNIASIHECKILLLFCKTFSVLSKNELDTINYIKQDRYFFTGPIIDIKNKDESFKNTREEIKNKSEKIIDNLKLENSRLSKNNISLQSQLNDLKCEIKECQQKEQFLIEHIQKINDQKSSQSDGVLIPNFVFEKYPIILMMINKALGKTCENDYYKFCSIIEMLSSKTYRKLLTFLPLLSRSSCSTFVRPLKSEYINMLQAFDDLPRVVSKIYNKLIMFDTNKKIEKNIYTTLGGDAASMNNDSNAPAIYAIKLLPFMKDIQPSVVHLMKTRPGSSPAYVVDRIFQIADCINKTSNAVVKFISTDGDVSFDKFHKDFFESNISQLLDHPFEEIVDAVKDLVCMPSSDPLHLIKSARARLMQHLLLLDPDKLICVNTTLFSQAVDLGPVFNDRSKYGAMKDAYPLALYSWYSFVQVMMKGRFEAAFYILPFFFFIETIRSPLLSQKMRLLFIGTAYRLFVNHLKNIRNVGTNSVFKQRFTSKYEIFLIRIINTCISLGVAIKYHPDNLALQRISTHDIELFFGLIRCLSCFDNSYFNAVRLSCEAMIIKEFSKELGSSVKIEKRENEAGIVLTPDINSQPDIDFDCLFLVEGVEKLMKGNDLDDEEMQRIFNIMNNYTNLIISPGTKYKIVRLPSLCQGTLPLHRYNIISYSISVLPLPEKKSTFQFYCGDKKFNKKLKKPSIFQWCVRLCASLNEMNFKCKKKNQNSF